MLTKFTESSVTVIVQDAMLLWISKLGYAMLHSPEITPSEAAKQTIVLRFRR